MVERAGIAGWEPASLAATGATQLTPPLPAVWAEGIARRLKPGPSLRDQARRLLRHLAASGVAVGVGERGKSAGHGPLPRPDPGRDSERRDSGQPWAPSALERTEASLTPLCWEEGWLARLTAGRRLTPGEIHRRALRLRGLPYPDRRPREEFESLVVALFRAAQAGKGRILPAVEWRLDGSLACSRCGEERLEAWPCSRCGQPACPQCEACASLGVLRGCDVLFEGAIPGGEEPATALFLRGGGGQAVGSENWKPESLPLSRAQADAARRLEEALCSLSRGPRGRRETEVLVWAVTGAGKTEVAVPAIRRVLNQGGRVLFAVPRRDVVMELGDRLAGYVAPWPVEVWYGGAPSRFRGPGGGSWGPGPLVVATTHQCLRFGPVFQLVIVDEVDAFPYRTEPFLQRGLARTLAPGGLLVTMTATPEKVRVRRAKREGFLITIPARHHGHPLPVPRWVRDRDMRHAGLQVPSFGPATLKVVEEARAAGPVLVFCPTIALVEATASALAERLAPPVSVRAVHSRHRGRDEAIEGFRRGEVDVLVTTTVLERGITVPGVQVVVLFADDESVFDEAALVQIAGRVGRREDCPGGLVAFVGRRPTGSVRRAVAHIREMNALAARGGYLAAGHAGAEENQQASGIRY